MNRDEKTSLKQVPLSRLAMSSAASRFILFGASMTEWSFDEETAGFGWFLEKVYRDKVAVVNEGKQDLFMSPSLRLPRI